MGLFGDGDERAFKPNCVVDSEKSSEGQTVIICNPIMKHKDRIEKTERPMQFVIQEGSAAAMIDDGGASEGMIDKMLTHIEKKRLG